MRTVSIVAVVIGMALVPLSVAAAVQSGDSKRQAVDRSLILEAGDHTLALRNYFERARSLTLLEAHNAAFSTFYTQPGPASREARIRAGGPTVEAVNSSLEYLQKLYPNSIGEACFIDAGGGENARAVFGHRQSARKLDPNERTNPFFKPTFIQPIGRVYQAPPYRSPDTGQWVVSNSTPVQFADGRKHAIVHFEVQLESFRRVAASDLGHYGSAIVDSDTGAVITDSRYPQRNHAPLGRPQDHRFARLAREHTNAGVFTVDGDRAAFRRVPATIGNANDWFVVATAPAPATGLLGFGLAEFGILALGLLLLVFGAVNLRAARRELTAAALTDSLTGLSNRRALNAALVEALGDRTDRELVLVLLDLDGFKNYNDTFGHQAGDVLLQRLGHRLAKTVSDGGQPFRMGGDEFCVLAPAGDGHVDAIVAAAATALSDQGEGFAISCSYGSVLLPHEATDPEEALHLADQRMYADKTSGRPSAGRQAQDALLRALQERNPELGDHVTGVGVLAEAVGRRLGIDGPELDELGQAGALHDIGKVAIPDAILNKPSTLDEEEWAFVRRHTLIGERILSAAPALAPIAKLVRASHERLDGKGYPDHLVGEAIPLGARIVAACDAYEAMTSDRPYRKAMSPEGAREELRRSAGTQFDPRVVDALCAELVEPAASPLPRA